MARVIENAENYAFAVEGRDGRDSYVDVAVREADSRATVLCQPALCNVERGHNLHATYDRRTILRRKTRYILEHSIDAIPNAGKYDGTVGVLGGLEAIRLIRESGGPMSWAPIYTLTANALPEHAQASAAAGANGHVTKPITPAALLDAVRRAAFEGAGDPAGRSEAASCRM